MTLSNLHPVSEPQSPHVLKAGIIMALFSESCSRDRMEEKHNGNTHHQTQSVNQKCGKQSQRNPCCQPHQHGGQALAPLNQPLGSRRQRREMLQLTWKNPTIWQAACGRSHSCSALKGEFRLAYSRRREQLEHTRGPELCRFLWQERANSDHRWPSRSLIVSVCRAG